MYDCQLGSLHQQPVRVRPRVDRVRPNQRLQLASRSGQDSIESLLIREAAGNRSIRCRRLGARSSSAVVRPHSRISPMATIADLAASLKTAVQASGVNVVSGSLGDLPEHTEVCITPDSGDPARVFQELAQLANVRIVLIHEIRLTTEDVQRTQRYYEANAFDDPDRVDLRELRRHIGQPHLIRVLGLPPGLAPVLSLTLTEDWAADVVWPDDDSYEEDERPDPPLSQEDRNIARQLAEHPTYPDASHSIRAALLRRLAPNARNVEGILEAAEESWQIDVKPAREDTLRSKALELLEQKVPKNKITAQLGLKSVHYLNKLLGEA